MNPVKIFMNIVEMRTKVVSMSTFLCASLASASFLRAYGRPFPWTDWGLMLAAVLAVDMGTTGFNTYFDFIKGVDRKETNREEAKVLVHNGVSPETAFFTSLALFAAAVVLGIIITFRTGFIVAAAGFICMLVGFFYSAGPKPISHTPFGEIFAGGFLGSVLFCLSWYVLTGVFTLESFLFSVPLSLMISGILTVNNNCDLESDRDAGRKTVSIVAGLAGGRLLLLAEYLAAAAFLFVMQYGMRIYPRGYVPVSAGLIILMAVLYTRMEMRGYKASTKGPSMMSILRIFMTGSVLMIYPWLFSG